MQKHERLVFRELKAVANACGAEISVSAGKRHMLFTLLLKGRRVVLPVSSSPSIDEHILVRAAVRQAQRAIASMEAAS
jgi:hypothetical protein